MLPRTTVPASAPATKKIQIRMMNSVEVMVASGYCSRKSNRATASSLVAAALSAPPSWSSRSRAVEPNTENQIMLKMLGAMSTPRMNSRMVRPREMRAMKTPT